MGALEIAISPLYGLLISRTRKIAPAMPGVRARLSGWARSAGQISGMSSATSRRSRSRPSLVSGPQREEAIELDDVGAQLLHLPFLRVERIVRRGDEQAQDQRRNGRDQAHHQRDHVLRAGIQMMLGQSRVEREPDQRPAEHAARDDGRNQQGCHR